ncbi:Rrf2 family transcriptional regulator [Komagataeibacter sp. FNDCR1]|nr:Rrf2 family transcriptional regulator [Komagataeibacter sp. FNDCR1]
MLKLSKLTDYAVVALVRLGQKEDVTTSPVLSRSTGIPEPTIAKVLAAQGIVISQRGARGGYRLARPLSQISVAAVIQAIDGPISLTTCVDGGECDARSKCGLVGQWDAVNGAILQALSSISLSDMQNHTVTSRRGPDAPSAALGPLATA